MNLGGIQKTSLIDFPGRVSCVLFLAGCNFDCPYCHNPELVSGKQSPPAMNASQLKAFLAKRRGLLDGVAITGGEPTLQSDLPELCRTIKALGFSIKLDTNGSRPAVLKKLIAEQLVDFVAMDVKTMPQQYAPLICRSCKPSEIIDSIQIIISSRLPHEFRTTCVKPIVNESVISAMANLLKGARRHALQRVQHETVNVLHPEFFKTHDWYLDDNDLERFRAIMAGHVDTCIIR